MSNATSTSTSAHSASSDRACRSRARAYLAELIGARPQGLTWDCTHRLQGHLHLGNRELVVIAPRDAAHQPVVLPEVGWDAVRRSPSEQRRELLDSWSITDRAGLASVLEADDLALCAPPVPLAA